MSVLLAMLNAVLHGPAIYSPIARRTVFDGLRHHVAVLLHIHKDHLEP